MGDGLGPGTPIGKYVVKRKLAEGGMAEIYLASVRGPEGFEKEVVIKRVRGFLATDPSFVQMFIAEARLASRLNHANIVQIFDFDRFEDTFYLAMEYVRGRSLWDVRRKSRQRMVPMPPVLVAHIGLEVARGLHYAHRLTDRGEPLHLVHRDVTPHNVLLSWEGAIKLTDFGIAKAGNKLTSPGMLKGKFAYMSPEQARGENVDARTDVFALGVVLWEMLTGGRLFEGDSDVAVLRAVQQSVIAPPGRLNADVAPELDSVVMKALARDPAVRWQTAQELERALAHFILRNAQSVDETDLGAFLRALYADELAGDGLDGSAGGVVNPLPQQVPPSAAPATATPSPSRREPTAVMPGSRGSGSRSPHRSSPAPTHSAPEAVSVSAPSIPSSASSATAPQEAGGTTPPPAYAPDEDPHASTFVPRRAEASAGQAVAPISLGTPKYVPPEAVASKEEGFPPELEAVPPRQAPAWVTAGADAAEAQQTSGTATANVIAAVQPKRRAGLLGGIAAVAALVAVAGLVLFPRAEPHVPEPPPEVPLGVGAPDAGAEPVDAGTLAFAEADAGISDPEPGPEDAGTPPIAEGAPVDAGTTPGPKPSGGTTRTAGTGTLLVYASPWARLTIDGQRIEEVSGWSNEITLPSGRRVIELWHPRRSQTVTVLIRPGGTRSVKFEVDLD